MLFCIQNVVTIFRLNITKSAIFVSGVSEWLEVTHQSSVELLAQKVKTVLKYSIAESYA